LSATVIYLFFSNIWLEQAHSRRRALDPTYYTSIDPVLPKDVPFGGFNAKKLYLGELFPKTSLIFSLE
jgi:hypothetical protein